MKRKASEDAPHQDTKRKRDSSPVAIRRRFRDGLFDEAQLQSYTKNYANSQPYKHCVIPSLITSDLLREVRSEIREHLSFTPKETDIYSIHQSGDLANLDGLDDGSLELLPSLLSLRDALYSPEFRTYLSSITGAGKLSGRKTDMAVNVYTPGCHLLCHDDVIGTRRVSYILYLTDPDVPWRDEWGGALRLYPTIDMKVGDGAGESYKMPSPDEGVRIPPAFGQLSFFAVQPGESFHDVEEVFAPIGTDSVPQNSKRERIAISGWYHIPQEGEDGYEPGLEDKLAEKSSLMQLQGKADQFDLPQPVITTYEQESHSQDESATQRDQSAQEEREDSEIFSESDLTFLLKYLAPTYLIPDTLASVAEAFTEKCTLVLENILSRKFSAALRTYIIDQESRSLPTASTDIESKTPWKVARPPHKHRFLYQQPKSALSPQTQVLGIQTPPASFSQSGPEPQADIPEEESPIQDLLNNLLPSLAFKKWLQCATTATILSNNLLARRFRRGNDYTLATGYDDESPRLEIMLAVTPTDGWGHDEVTEEEAEKVEEQGGDGKKEAEIITSQAEHEQESKTEAEEKTEEGNKTEATNALPTEKEQESNTEAEEQKEELKKTEKINALPTDKERQSQTEAEEQKEDGNKTDTEKERQSQTAAEEQETKEEKSDKPQAGKEQDGNTATEEQEAEREEAKTNKIQAEKETEQESKAEAQPTAHPATGVGGYLTYIATDDDKMDEDSAVDEAGSNAGIEIPPSLSTAAAHPSTPISPSPKIQEQPASDPAVYKAAGNGILFSMPAGWNRLAMILRDRDTMRFVKYVSRAARGDRWDLVGEFAVKDVGFDDGGGEEEGEEEGGWEEGREEEGWKEGGEERGAGAGVGAVDLGEEETEVEIPTTETESDDSSF
ncbi:MAG: hypothetical protein HETSPECPRED_004536 [Heterodermia speciosa]|uniref:uS12 prolyl 3,4-dihydroxylase n=1 Tax=Heterodermia speciosa TaxID=116794 RepID=A0A8H3FBP8_9LECA|nr:MAG: hypothetical protein HETSPECPRED_004536 [Heterodermia speciosa]